MAQDAIDELRYRAERTATRLFVLAGVSSGLIITVGMLFLQAGRLRSALAVFVLALAVGTFMVIAAQHIRFSALSLYEVGSELRGEAITLRRRQGEVLERLGDLRTRDHGVERALVDLRARVRELEADRDGQSPLVVPELEHAVQDAPAPPRAQATGELPATQAFEPPR